MYLAINKRKKLAMIMPPEMNLTDAICLSPNRGRDDYYGTFLRLSSVEECMSVISKKNLTIQEYVPCR